MESLASFYLLLKVLVIAVDVALIAAFVHVARRAASVRPDIAGAPSEEAAATAASAARARAVAEAWEKIAAQAARGAEAKRLAVIDADRLADRLLKDAGFEGEGALERMRQLPGERLATVGGLIDAHRLRNRLVHEASYVPADRDLDAALGQYRAFLAEVGYLS